MPRRKKAILRCAQDDSRTERLRRRQRRTAVLRSPLVVASSGMSRRSACAPLGICAVRHLRSSEVGEVSRFALFLFALLKEDWFSICSKHIFECSANLVERAVSSRAFQDVWEHILRPPRRFT